VQALPETVVMVVMEVQVAMGGAAGMVVEGWEEPPMHSSEPIHLRTLTIRVHPYS